MDKNISEPLQEVIKFSISTRNELGLSQDMLARLMGTNQANISRLESGNHNPSIEFIRKLAAAMGKKVHITFE